MSNQLLARQREADRDLERRVAASLAARRISALRRLKISADGGLVTLRGTLASHYEKQLGQQTTRLVPGVLDVLAEIDVLPDYQYPPAGRYAFSPQLEQFFDRRRREAAASASGDRERGGLQRWSLARIAVAVSVLLLVAGSIVLAASHRAEPLLAVFPVNGKLFIEGEPASGALVVFHPQGVDRAAPRPKGYVDARGNFVISTFQPGDGAPSGEYRVTVELRELVVRGDEAVLGPNVVAPKYGRVSTTTLSARVGDGGFNRFQFKVERDGPMSATRPATRVYE